METKMCISLTGGKSKMGVSWLKVKMRSIAIPEMGLSKNVKRNARRRQRKRQAKRLEDEKKAEDQLCHLAMRGRHFNISLMCCSVSYTSIPKSCRRSLDVLLLFSCPMSGDLQTLTWEFTRDSEMARFAVNNLGEHECLVLETLTRKQCLYVWRAKLTTARRLGLLDPSEQKTSEDCERPEENPASRPRGNTPVPSDCTPVSVRNRSGTEVRTSPPHETQNS